jgi:hypothetical protein
VAAIAYTAAAIDRFVSTAMGNVEREYPNHITHWLGSDADARPPRELTPIFYGCLDWHSAVHSHWLLARALNDFPDASFAAGIRDRCARAFTPENVAGEVAYMGAPERVSFERPYGLAWLLTLDAELARAPETAWREALSPLTALAAERLWSWLDKIRYPIRGGEHSQTAFAFGLMLDWAGATNESRRADSLRERCRRFYGSDVDAPLAYEPSAHDFLSPALAEADLMRRVFMPVDFAAWLDEFLPGFAGGVDFAPVEIADRADPKLAHFDGLNLSRAWMLRGVASGLPPHDTRREPLLQAAADHASAGLAGAETQHYAGTHWLGTFAVYWLSGAGSPRLKSGA